MKIGIVGLGLMGGSFAMGLSQKGHLVYGMDSNLDTLNFAIEKNWVTGVLSQEEYSKMDLLILAIYPQTILNFLKTNQHYFKAHQVITDICGVKSSFVEKATLLAKPAIYCSCHPMAGKEKKGIQYADAKIFLGANFLITPLPNTNESAMNILKQIGLDLGFGHISLVDIDRHDKMIGFTSQLTHAIAVSLVNSDQDPDTGLFIGDSYRDLTRIAMINESLWSELFLENKTYLLEHIEHFERELDRLKEAICNEQKEELEAIFKKSTSIRRKMEKCEN